MQDCSSRYHDVLAHVKPEARIKPEFLIMRKVPVTPQKSSVSPSRAECPRSLCPLLWRGTQHLLTDQFLQSDNGPSLFCLLTQLIAYDATAEHDADSQQAGLSREDPAVPHSLGKHTVSGEWADKRHGQDSSERDSSERDSKQHERSMENDSRQKPDSREVAGDDSKAAVRRNSHQSTESRESQVRISAEIPDDNSNQSVESAENAPDRHSLENNEVTL